MPERAADQPASRDEELELTPAPFDIKPVAVVVEGPIHTVDAPPKLITLSTVYADSPRSLAARDLRRAKLRVAVTTAQNAIIATSMQDVQAGLASAPAGSAGPIAVLTQAMGYVEIEGVDSIYVSSTTVGTPAIVSVIIEQWSD